MWQKCFFFFNVPKILHKQVSAWRTTIMSPLLPLSLRHNRLLCRHGDTHSTSCALPNTASASACIPVQSCLCLNLCKLTQVSERSPSNIHRVCPWQTQSNNVHTEEKKEREKTGRERGLASLEGRLTKKLSEHWRLSLPPAVWLGWVLVAVHPTTLGGRPGDQVVV